jgi:hypothetical protein
MPGPRLPLAAGVFVAPRSRTRSADLIALAISLKFLHFFLAFSKLLIYVKRFVVQNQICITPTQHESGGCE